MRQSRWQGRGAYQPVPVADRANSQGTSREEGNNVANDEKPKMTWYETMRHNFVSRHLSGGASLDEVSATVGHSSPVVTKRFCEHYARRSFSPKLRAGLGFGQKKEGARVPMKKARRSAAG
jgi:hypothetical protein